MKFLPCFLLAFSLATTAFAQAVKFVGAPERHVVHTAFPIRSGEAVVMDMLLPPNTDLAALHADLVQMAGTIAAPLDTVVSVESVPMDLRLVRVHFTAPDVTRITYLRLRFSGISVYPLIVFPPEQGREDRPDLAKLLRSTHQRLLVCGPSEELRNYLRENVLPFEDLGSKAPHRLHADEVLFGELSAEDWARLSATDAPGRLLAAVDDPSLLPGVYTTLRPSGPACKITLLLFPLLSDNPQARETLAGLLLSTLSYTKP